MELDKNIEQELAELLADPEKVSPQHTGMLNDLLQEYPYYQPLHLLLAKANLNAEVNNALAKAALYTNGQTLHRFLFEKRETIADFQLNEVPAAIGADLQVVTDEPFPVADEQETYEEISEPTSFAQFETRVAEPEEENISIQENAEAEEFSTAADEQETYEEISEPAGIAHFETIPAPTVADIPAEDILAEAEENVFEEIGEVDYEAYRPFRNSPPEDLAKPEETSNAFYTVSPKDRGVTPAESLPEEESHVDSDIEGYSEEIENQEHIADQKPTPEPAIEEYSEEIENQEHNIADQEDVADLTDPADAENTGNVTDEEDLENATGAASVPDSASVADQATQQTVNTEPEAQKNTLEDDFVFESIVSTDFFAFENNFSSVEEVEPEKPEVIVPPVIEEHEAVAAAEVENSRVSNYNDDKLPYTFLWWLAKTRKEHESFQPYVAAKKPGSNELQQQYVEHIFHIQSHLTGNESLLESTDQAKPVSKDFQIIDSFIKNDPQIHPPNAEQIDNENKAKKSAEDQNDLVSETLAGIYIEQMLYDKAIDTYEKLSLKFPEKSRYFADLIQSIEKKI